MPRCPQSAGTSVFDAALEAMNAAELRDLLRRLMAGLDDAVRARLMNEAVSRAARSTTGWAPGSPGERRVKEIEAFAVAASRKGYAEPGEVDDCLRDGTHAFLARDYPTALRVFRALLIPIGAADIDLGQHERVDEVLGADVHACASQYVVASYMTASPGDRAAAVLSAIEDVDGVGNFFEPIRQLERAAVEPLPDLDDFLERWRALVESRCGAAVSSDRDRREDRWLREVVGRTRGPAGLAEVARASRRADDLRAWCRALEEAGDWNAAREAYEEAVGLVADRDWACGEFLDGAALAAQELRSDDLDAVLEDAWRRAPTLTRLRRWLGGCSTRGSLNDRAAAAIDAAPREASRQRVLLHIVGGEYEPAARLLAAAHGSGWSGAEHPGHLAVPVFARLLGEREMPLALPPTYEDLGDLIEADDRPRLRTPDLDELLVVARLRRPEDASVRAVMIAAMREAAEKRLAAVTASKRRRHYAHAASLAVLCAAVDRSADAQAWLRRLRDDYRRYPALSREFQTAGG